MIKCGVDVIKFEEPDILTPVPSCVDQVAGMILGGHWLKQPPNFESVILGCKRLPQFKDAKRASLRREIRWHFINRLMPCRHAGGRQLRPVDWLLHWNEDKAFRKVVLADPKWRHYRDELALKVRKATPCVLAVEDTRQAYATLQDKDPAAAAAMHNFMEEGGIS